MFRKIFSLIVLASLAQSGANLYELRKCRTRPCNGKIAAKSKWQFSKSVQPISIFPEEAKRFK